MDDYLKEAIDIVKAQASVRIMADEEITTLIQRLAQEIRRIAEHDFTLETSPAEALADARKSIKEKTITCLDCGKTFKILTKRHLIIHGLDANSYREKWGMKKDTPLVCKSLQRERRKKMKEMRLWEKRRKVQ